MNRRLLWLIVPALILAAGLRAWGIDAQSIWFDEGFSWHAATQPDLIATLNGDPTNPPLYYLLLHIWVRLVGDSEFALRALSLLQGILLLALIGAAARQWFASRTAVPAVIFGAFMPLLWWASQEARMYNTLALAVLIGAIGLFRLLRDSNPPGWAWIAVLGGELAALYTHNTGLVVVAAFNVIAISSQLSAIRKSLRPLRLTSACTTKWLAGQIAVAILWLPEALARFVEVGGANQTTATPPELSPMLLWQSWHGLWAGSWEMVRGQDSRTQLIALLLLPLLLLALLLLRKRQGRYLIGLIAVLYVALIAALAVLGVGLHGRYLVMIAPLVVIAVSYPLSVISKASKIGTVVTAAMILAATAWVWLPGGPLPPSNYQHDQAREMVAYYARELGPDDLVLAWSYAERYDLLYYWDRLGVQAQMLTLPEGADEDEIIPLINAAFSERSGPIRAELNTWYTQRADLRGMLPCLLEHGHVPPTQRFTVNGMFSTTYMLDGLIGRPELQPVEPMLFRPMQLDLGGSPAVTLHADESVCLPLDFSLIDTADEDYFVAANAINPLGWEFAGTDGPILTAGQVSTRHLAAGDPTQAYLLLRLPPGTPQGEYPLRLRVYSEANFSGLEVRDPATGAPMGRDASLGTLTVEAGQWSQDDLNCLRNVAPGAALQRCETDEAAGASTLFPGETLRLSLNWWIEDTPPEATLILAGDGWQVSDTSFLPAQGLVLDWRELTVPAEAWGQAELTVQVGDGEPFALHEYIVSTSEHRMTPPEVGQRIDIGFPGIGTLYGFTLPETTLRRGEPFDVTLVWEAAGTVPTAYTVTVQLLDESGRLLAQHDSIPTDGERPTTGWIAGEYIVDPHRLSFREEAAGYSGAARLIVALYEPLSGNRVLTDSGMDHAELAVSIEITDP